MMLLRAWGTAGSDVESVPAIINSNPVSCGQRAVGVPPPSSRANNLSLRSSFPVFSCSNIHHLHCKLAES